MSNYQLFRKKKKWGERIGDFGKRELASARSGVGSSQCRNGVRSEMGVIKRNFGKSTKMEPVRFRLYQGISEYRRVRKCMFQRRGNTAISE